MAAHDEPSRCGVTVVVASRDRRDSLRATLDRLTRLPERPAVTVVDNGSRDGTPEAVRAGHPSVGVVSLGYNAGGAAGQWVPDRRAPLRRLQR